MFFETLDPCHIAEDAPSKAQQCELRRYCKMPDEGSSCADSLCVLASFFRRMFPFPAQSPSATSQSLHRDEHRWQELKWGCDWFPVL